MAAILVVTAATLASHRAAPLTSVGEISTALSPYLGAFASRVTFALGIGGAALLAAIVVSLAVSWAVAEAFGTRRSLNDTPRSASLFYGIYTACVTVGAAIVLASHSLVRVAVDVEILNALLLPLVIGFLVALAWTTLPHPHRLRAGERLAVAAVAATVIVIGLGWTALTILPSSGTPSRPDVSRIELSKAKTPSRAAVLASQCTCGPRAPASPSNRRGRRSPEPQAQTRPSFTRRSLSATRSTPDRPGASQGP